MSIKYIFIFLFGTILFSSCTPTNRAEGLIRSYLKKNLDDAESYDPAEFGPLVELHVEPIDRQLYLMSIGIGDNSAYNDMSKKETKAIKGYYMKHTFRAKNGFGGILKKEYEFYFDKDITNVVDVYKFD